MSRLSLAVKTREYAVGIMVMTKSKQVYNRFFMLSQLTAFDQGWRRIYRTMQSQNKLVLGVGLLSTNQQRQLQMKMRIQEYLQNLLRVGCLRSMTCEFLLIPEVFRVCCARAS